MKIIFTFAAIFLFRIAVCYSQIESDDPSIFSVYGIYKLAAAESHVKEKLISSGGGDFAKVINWKDPLPQNRLHLVFKRNIKLNTKSRMILIFDSDGWTSVSDSPRIIALLDKSYKVISWHRFDSAFPFGYSTFLQCPDQKDAEMLVFNPASRFCGELFIQRYHLTADNITFIEESTFGKKPGKPEQGAAANP